MKIKLKIKKEDLKKKLDIKDGKNADEQKVVALAVDEVLSKIPTPVFPTETLDEMKAEIELLKEIEEKYKELEKKISELPKGGRVARGFQLLTDGTKRGLTVNTMNLIGGTGVTLTYNYASGRNDITLSTTGGGGILTATGTVNGTNDTFTFASEPTTLIVDGVPKRKVQSDGTVNWTGTTTVVLTLPPNYDIYGIA